jgi:hypothetical protein
MIGTTRTDITKSPEANDELVVDQGIESIGARVTRFSKLANDIIEICDSGKDQAGIPLQERSINSAEI